jgi:hypothetical protein
MAMRMGWKAAGAAVVAAVGIASGAQAQTPEDIARLERFSRDRGRALALTHQPHRVQCTLRLLRTRGPPRALRRPRAAGGRRSGRAVVVGRREVRRTVGMEPAGRPEGQPEVQGEAPVGPGATVLQVCSAIIVIAAARLSPGGSRHDASTSAW